MDWEELIIGGLAVAWGIILLCARNEILGLAREGGRGLRNRKVIAVLIAAAVAFLFAGGAAIIAVRGF